MIDHLTLTVKICYYWYITVFAERSRFQKWGRLFFMAIKYDKVLDEVREWDNIPQYSVDPTNPKPESAWVRGNGGQAIGSPIGLGLLFTYSSNVAAAYEFRYRTKEGITVGVTLS